MSTPMRKDTEQLAGLMFTFKNILTHSALFIFVCSLVLFVSPENCLCVLAQVLKPSGDELRNRSRRYRLDCLVQGVSHRSILSPGACQHLLQEQWSEGSL